jgi:5-methylcytosine-specific restriction endonuclease McrA
MPEPFPKSRQLARGEKRYRRKVASPKQWAAIRAEKLDEQPCAICGDYSPLTAHHLVPRSAGGDDVPENIVGLCGDGTTFCHGAVTRRDSGALQELARSLTDAEYAYVVGKLGEGALSRLFGV